MPGPAQSQQPGMMLLYQSSGVLTRQNTVDGVIATLPIPANTVKVGDCLKLDIMAGLPAISTATRLFVVRLGAAGSGVSGAQMFIRTETASGATRTFSGMVKINAYSLNGLQNVTPSYYEGYFGLAPTAPSAPSVNFTQDLDLNITGYSCNEGALTIAGASWLAGLATINVTAHGYASSDKTVIAAVNPAGYNGTHIIDSIVDANNFKVPIAADPGAWVSGGTSTRVSNLIIYNYDLVLMRV